VNGQRGSVESVMVRGVVVVASEWTEGDCGECDGVRGSCRGE
jgi:hypothetical protein